MDTILMQKNRTKRIEAETLRKFLIKNKRDLSSCRICHSQETKIYIHHINGNFLDNRLGNIVVLCSSCHFAIHFKPNKLLQRNLNNSWNKGRIFTDKHKKNISLSKLGKSYEEFMGKEKSEMRIKNISNIMKNKVLDYNRDEKGRFIKKI